MKVIDRRAAPPNRWAGRTIVAGVVGAWLVTLAATVGFVQAGRPLIGGLAGGGSHLMIVAAVLVVRRQRPRRARTGRHTRQARPRATRTPPGNHRRTPAGRVVAPTGASRARFRLAMHAVENASRKKALISAGSTGRRRQRGVVEHAGTVPGGTDNVAIERVITSSAVGSSRLTLTEPVNLFEAPSRWIY